MHSRELKVYLRQLSAVGDDDRLGRLSARRSNTLNLLHDVHAAGDGAEDAVLSVEPRRGDGAEEELASVGVGSGVGHGEDSRSRVLQREVLVRELGAVDGLSTGTVSGGEVTSLAHEVCDDAVEAGSLEVQRLSRLADALLSRAERAEVLRRLGSDVGAERHFDASRGRAADGDVEENNRVRLVSKNSCCILYVVCVYGIYISSKYECENKTKIKSPHQHPKHCDPTLLDKGFDHLTCAYKRHSEINYDQTQ